MACATATIPPWLRALIIERDKGTCRVCNEPVNLELRPGTDTWAGTIDHIIPVRLGGPCKDPRNLQLTHRSCNNVRGRRLDKKIGPNPPYLRDKSGSRIRPMWSSIPSKLQEGARALFDDDEVALLELFLIEGLMS